MAAVNLFTARNKNQGRTPTSSKILTDRANENKTVFSNSYTHLFIGGNFKSSLQKSLRKIIATKMKKLNVVYIVNKFMYVSILKTPSGQNPHFIKNIYLVAKQYFNSH